MLIKMLRRARSTLRQVTGHLGLPESHRIRVRILNQRSGGGSR